MIKSAEKQRPYPLGHGGHPVQRMPCLLPKQCPKWTLLITRAVSKVVVVVVVVLGFCFPPTANVIPRQVLILKSHPKDWRSQGSNSRPLVNKASSLTTTQWRLLSVQSISCLLPEQCPKYTMFITIPCLLSEQWPKYTMFITKAVSKVDNVYYQSCDQSRPCLLPKQCPKWYMFITRAVSKVYHVYTQSSAQSIPSLIPKHCPKNIMFITKAVSKGYHV